MRLADLFAICIKRLGDTQRALEIELLIEKAFAWERTSFWINKQNPIADAKALRRFHRLFDRLLAGEPLSYILGQKEFYSQVFFINRHTLIPRPETELLVEKALARMPPHATVLDIGAGSGIISIILALKADCRVIAVEKSRRALAVMRENIAKHKLGKRVRETWADLFPDDHHRFDLIVSNPPYLSDADWESLPVHIKQFEPKNALVAGPQGTEIIGQIIRGVEKRLKRGGNLLLEVGLGQKKEVEHMLRAGSFQEWEWFQDYQGIDRVVAVRSE